MGLNTDWLHRSMLIARHIPGDSSVIDLGAGDGLLGHLLLPGCTYTAVDKVPFASWYLKADFDEPLPDFGKYDVATVVGVLEHLKRPQGFLRAAGRIAPLWLIACRKDYPVFNDIEPAMKKSWLHLAETWDISRGNADEALLIFRGKR